MNSKNVAFKNKSLPLEGHAGSVEPNFISHCIRIGRHGIE